jgi:hypothetical protein
MSECEGTTEFEGLSLQLNSLVSCHVCKDVTKIPFVSVRVGTVEDKFRIESL